MESGGEGLGFWKSIDGGDNWEEIMCVFGFFKGFIGVIGIVVLLVNFDCIWVMVELLEGGVF